MQKSFTHRLFSTPQSKTLQSLELQPPFRGAGGQNEGQVAGGQGGKLGAGYRGQGANTLRNL
jgi:hypothetical protein